MDEVVIIVAIILCLLLSVMAIILFFCFWQKQKQTIHISIVEQAACKQLKILDEGKANQNNEENVEIINNLHEMENSQNNEENVEIINNLHEIRNSQNNEENVEIINNLQEIEDSQKNENIKIINHNHETNYNTVNKQMNSKEAMVTTSSIAANNNQENKKLSEPDEMRIAYHECGHIIVSWSLRNADPPKKVTIIGEDWKLGCTTFSEHESKFWKFEEMLDKMASLLGGYAVEKLLLDGLTDGSTSDMEQATEIAYKLVIKFGMVKEIGPIRINYQDCSEYLKTKIDIAAKKLLDDALEQAEKIVSAKKSVIKKLADHLLNVKTIEEDELKQVLGPRVFWPEKEETDDVTATQMQQQTGETKE
ncbi:unnamed protein product [Meloidogyne enterolobii]|uniref:Uncharacterized protein n=1 Tax=Meloidogyne enterolobii TaxID=390850 RepID=A0ACB0YMI0_MELEN